MAYIVQTGIFLINEQYKPFWENLEKFRWIFYSPITWETIITDSNFKLNPKKKTERIKLRENLYLWLRKNKFFRTTDNSYIFKLNSCFVTTQR